MRKTFNAFILLTCVSVFQISSANSAETEQEATPVQPAKHRAKKTHVPKAPVPTLSTLKNELDELQKEMVAVAQSQAAILRALEQSKNDQLSKLSQPDLYTYP